MTSRGGGGGGGKTRRGERTMAGKQSTADPCHGARSGERTMTGRQSTPGSPGGARTPRAALEASPPAAVLAARACRAGGEERQGRQRFPSVGDAQRDPQEANLQRARASPWASSADIV